MGGVKLIVGLGNPGIEYQFTPHNAGFLALDRLAERAGVVLGNRRGRAVTARAVVAGQEALLAKPETFMNLSGLAVAALVEELGISVVGQDVIVLYDELAFAMGELRVKERGSANGHNGVRSISGALGTEEWIRVRIGVGKETAAGGREAKAGGRDYLLSPMRRMQMGVLSEALDEACDAVEMIVREGVGAAMNRFNRKEKGPEKGDRKL